MAIFTYTNAAKVGARPRPRPSPRLRGLFHARGLGSFRKQPFLLKFLEVESGKVTHMCGLHLSRKAMAGHRPLLPRPPTEEQPTEVKEKALQPQGGRVLGARCWEADRDLGSRCFSWLSWLCKASVSWERLGQKCGQGFTKLVTRTEGQASCFLFSLKPQPRADAPGAGTAPHVPGVMALWPSGTLSQSRGEHDRAFA